MIYNLLIKIRDLFIKYLLRILASNRSATYICTTIIEKGYAKVAQLVERDLAKVEVAGSNPVFRSENISTGNGAFFLISASVINNG